MDHSESGFLERCRSFADTLPAIAERKETVGDLTAFRSILIIRNMKVCKLGDALLYAAALNVLNAYVKQSKEQKKTVGYFFKNYTDILGRYKSGDPDSLLQIEIQQDHGMSLMLVQIGALQFSFHQVPLTDHNRQFMATDLEHPRIVWDGIRKQHCAESLFRFAMENDHERTNAMFADGGDFKAYLQELTEKFQAGAVSIKELIAKRKGYTKEAKCQANSVISRTTDRPFRHQPVFALYRGFMKDFLEACRGRKIVQYIVNNYIEGMGKELSFVFVLDFKYALENIYYMLLNAHPNDRSIVEVEYVRGYEQDHFNLIISSYNQSIGKWDFSVIEFLSWKSMKPGKKHMVLYRDFMDGLSFEDVDPRRQLASYFTFIFKGIEDEENIRKHLCVYFYDAQNEGFADISTEEYADIPLFFAHDSAMISFVEPSLRGSVTEKQFSYCLSLEKMLPDLESDISLDQLYVNQLLRNYTSQESAFLMLIDGRLDVANLEVYLENSPALRLEGLNCITVKGDETPVIQPDTQIVIYLDTVPESADLHDNLYNIVVFDPFTKTEDEKERILSLETDLQDHGIPVHKHSLTNAAHFADRGGGNNWLIRHFALDLIPMQQWNPSFYPIEVVHSEKNFTSEEGIANVFVPKSISFDPDKKLVTASEESRIKLYEDLSRGKKGVRLLIEDDKLRAYIRQEIKDEKERYHWLAQFNAVGPMDDEKLMEAAGKVLENSAIHNKYENLARRNLGAAWDKLGDDSQKWLLSALLSFVDMKDYDQMMDFSGIVLQISKVFESEALKRCGNMYKRFLIEKFGIEHLELWPEAMKKRVNGTYRPLPDKCLTLGALPFITGIGTGQSGKLYDPEGAALFCEYAMGRIIEAESTEELIAKLRTLLKITEYIRQNYRNISAHSYEINLMLAQNCMEYCITKNRMLGTMMELFKE